MEMQYNFLLIGINTLGSDYIDLNPERGIDYLRLSSFSLTGARH